MIRLTLTNFKKYCSKYDLVFVYDSSAQKEQLVDNCLTHVEKYYEIAMVLSPNILAFKNDHGYISFNCVKYVIYNNEGDNEYDSIDIVCGGIGTDITHKIIIEKRIPKACY